MPGVTGSQADGLGTFQDTRMVGRLSRPGGLGSLLERGH